MSASERDPTQADPSVTPAHAARDLIRRASKASLATLLPDPAGWPFASMVIPGTDTDASPLLVLSDLAQHARNLAADNRASLLIEGVAEDGNRQATPRVTLVGRAVKTSDEASRTRYQSRNPDSYLGLLADFHLYRFEMEQVHFIGGFARARRMEAAELLLPAPELRRAEPQLKDKLNANPGNPTARLATARGLGAGLWQVIGVDAEGIDIQSDSGIARVAFAKAVFNIDEFDSAIETILTNS